MESQKPASKNNIKEIEKPAVKNNIKEIEDVGNNDDSKPVIREKRDMSGEMSMKENPFRIDQKISIVKSEDDPFRFLP